VIRAFTREISLHASFETELDEQRILDEAIDRLLLKVEEDRQLKNWLVSFAEERMEDGKNWNLRDEISKLGRQVFRETYKGFGAEMGEKLSDKNFLSHFLVALRSIRDSFEADLSEAGKKAIKTIEQAGYGIGDFSYGKSGISGYFVKLANLKQNDFEPGKRVEEARENPDKWLAKRMEKGKRNALLGLVENTLHPILCVILDYIENHKELYYSTDVVLSYFYTLGILNDLSREVRAVTKENNLLLLSDSNYLLKGVIGQEDAPFIYEKIGNRYTNYMIDEFQDTSSLQWQNFRPLVENALAGGDDCLVVGDVKQSIYRWRNGDWKLLASQLKKEFDIAGEETLAHNWRSEQNIIDFNNTFFHFASGILQEVFNKELAANSNAEHQLEGLKNLLREAYFQHFQKFPHSGISRSGTVEIQFIDEKEVESWKEEALVRMIKRIEQLQDADVALKDIAILVRSGSEGRMVAEALLQHPLTKENDPYRFDVISNDSLFVGSASCVRFILQFLQFLTQPDNGIARGFLLHEYEKYLRPLLGVADQTGQMSFGFAEEEKQEHPLFARQGEVPGEFNRWFDPENDDLLLQLQNKPLYELVELVVKDFRLDEITSELPFLQAFLDKVLDFSRSEMNDVNSFLEWWSNFGGKQTINVSEQQDAIRVLTIHKSKGLQFKTVLMPFCDWELYPAGNKENILWCKPEVAPFNQLEVIPVKYSPKLAKTIFSKDYFNEKFHSFVDNLNLLYVAFTRAESALWTCSPLPKAGKMDRVKDLLCHVIKEQDKYSFENPDNEELLALKALWDEENSIFQLGEFEAKEVKKSVVSESKERKPGAWDLNPMFLSKRFYFGGQAENLEIKRHSEDYFLLKDDQANNPVNKGRLIHALFEKMKTLEDMEPALKRLQFEGQINKEEAMEMQQEIKKVLKHPFAQSWFDGSWNVLNEQSILLKKEVGVDAAVNQKRPDRIMLKDDEIVVVDYKSGEYESLNYLLQVKGYMLTLKEMGYENVKGYVWYLKKDKIVEVE